MTGSRTLPTITWGVLIACAVVNTAASAAGASWTVHLALGAVTAVCLAALTAVHLRSRG